jgi:hydrogenase expression/formation protein HypD
MLESLKNKHIIFGLKKIIADTCFSLGRIKIMHVCGTHEQAISRYGLRALLPENLEVISGPGCPVCCTPAFDIDNLVTLSLEKNVLITCFGDMLKVMGSRISLSQAKARGAKVKIVYSILDAIEFAREHSDIQVVHSAIGFETTAPTTAAALLNNCPTNFSILCSHRLIPPAMDALLCQKDNRIDGFLAPGHVSVIIGGKAYAPLTNKYNRPIVVSGFEPADIFYSIYLIAKQIKENQPKVEIEYRRAVEWQPQKKAVSMLKKTFDIENSFWRGLGEIANSGFVLKNKFKDFDALHKFNLKKQVQDSVSFKNCLCAEVLKGKIYPNQCPSFAKTCKPQHPLGPCMVSYEGSCAIFYTYRGNKD